MKNVGLILIVAMGMAVAGCENEQGDNGYSHNADIASQYGPQGAPVNPTIRAAESDDAGK